MRFNCTHCYVFAIICTAITTVVTIAEILKNNGFAKEKSKSEEIIKKERVIYESIPSN